MRHLWLLLLIACGSVQFPGVLTLPEALPAKSSSAAEGGNAGGAGAAVTAPSAGDTSKDYDYEEDQQRAPGNLAKATADPQVPEPYFEHSEVVVTVSQNSTSAKLKCPVKNYNAAHHVVLWYKEKVQLSSGMNIFNHIFALDEQFTLTVPLASNATEEHYECEVLPNKVRHKATIRFGRQPSTPTPSVLPLPADTASSAKDSAAHGRDISLWLLGLFLAPLQLAVTFRF
ncbi:uncharacterized protein LOC6548246 [Drosophila erecta]|uniref:Ig-like domain-containing protein n=1 Tax=Drosophila erecta TaxID=7220 RepID=B3NNN8_DROER|nr:uncharacterized protein LOC6548246 [Drosophila erecta]EDV55595.1 uncharacterized protein Dere_GG22186 [Drosophila erecta]